MEVLLIIIGIVGVIFLFHYISKSGKRMLRDQNDRIKNASKAKARILGYSLSSTRGNGVHGFYQVYKFTLEVLKPNEQSYKATAYWEVYQMAIPTVQQGSEVNVKIDSDNPQIIYPSIPSVEFSWLESKSKLLSKLSEE